MGLFTYCWDNPINHIDLLGKRTFGVFLNINRTAFFSFSFSIGFAIDDKGNLDWQMSYAIPFMEETPSIGLLDAGNGVSFQMTNLNTVYDLRGPATSMGASYGALGYVGVDAISFSPNKDLSMANGIDGWQVTLGYGIGIDIHVMRTITESLIKTQKTYSQDKMTILKVHQEKQLLYRNRGLAIKKMTK